MTVLCFKTGNITSLYRNIVFSCFESKSSTIGNNKRDNGKLVMLSSLNKFHFEAFFLINKFVVFFFQGNAIDLKTRMTKRHRVLIWAFFKNMLVTGKGKKFVLEKIETASRNCYIFNNHFLFWSDP